MKKSIAPLGLYVFLFIACIPLPGCIHRKQIDRQKLHITLPTKNEPPPLTKAPDVTIWVHGTLIFRKPMYHYIFNDTSSLVPITSLPTDHHFYILANTIAERDPEHFPLQEFYIFSWSGQLKNQERINAAHKLHDEIIALAKHYQEKYGCEPTIRIIAHSHGGNVVLNMAHIKNPLHPFRIKALILLACPVQDKTMHLISTPMFQRVYSLYSSLDMIQIIAPQFERIKTKNGRRKKQYNILPFSSRTFPIYSHLTQSKIKINDFPISHTRFSTNEFAAMLPAVLQKLESWHAQTLAANKIAKHKLLCIYKDKNC